MHDKVIITCNVTGGLSMHGSQTPVTDEAIARSAIEAAGAGAAIIKLHISKQGGFSPGNQNMLVRTVKMIRAGCESLVSLDVSGQTGYSLNGRHFKEINTFIEYIRCKHPGFDMDRYIDGLVEERCAPLESIKPDLASFKGGTINTGDSVYFNLNRMMQAKVLVMKEYGIKQVIECFSEGMLDNINRFLIQTGYLEKPYLLELSFNEPAGLAAETRELLHMVALLPTDTLWFASGKHAGGYEHQSILYTALAMGGHVRTGLGDTAYLQRRVHARSNQELVSRAAAAIEELGMQPATPAETRLLLGLG